MTAISRGGRKIMARKAMMPTVKAKTAAAGFDNEKRRSSDRRFFAECARATSVSQKFVMFWGGGEVASVFYMMLRENPHLLK